MSALQKNKKAAVGVGIAALAVAGLALGTGTYAAFTDTEAGPGGTLAAGTLTLDIGSDPSGTTTTFDAEKIYPGQTLPPRTVTIKNSGSLDGRITSTSTVENQGGVLQEHLKVSSACTSDKDPSHNYSVSDAPVGYLAPGVGAPGLPLNSGETLTCTFTFSLPYDTPNEAQGGSVTIASTFTLTQATP